MPKDLAENVNIDMNAVMKDTDKMITGSLERVLDIPKGTTEEANETKGCWPKLSLKERIIGSLACSVLGWMLSFFSSVSLVTSDSIA